MAVRRSFVVCGFANRSIQQWRPFFDELQRTSGEVRLCLFPKISDPDRVNLDRQPYEVIYKSYIDNGLMPIDVGLKEFWDEVANNIGNAKPTHIFCCTAHAGPERFLRQNIRRRGVDAVVIGLQHGYQQWWDGYNANWDFDYFGTFGSGYLNNFRKNIQRFVLPLGLPNLDLVSDCSIVESAAPMLFVAQSEPSAEKLEGFFERIVEKYNRDILIKPHPELYGAFDALRSKFNFTDDESLEYLLRNTSIVISTGSTAVLYALAAGKNILILPAQSGNLYSELGIVLDKIDEESADSVLSYQKTGEFLIKRKNFLIKYTGSDLPIRTKRALDIFKYYL